MATAGVCAWCRERSPHPDWRPFCSERCRLLDLAHWIDGKYRVPGDAVDAVSDDDTDAAVTDERDRPPGRRT